MKKEFNVLTKIRQMIELKAVYPVEYTLENATIKLNQIILDDYAANGAEAATYLAHIRGFYERNNMMMMDSWMYFKTEDDLMHFILKYDLT